MSPDKYSPRHYPASVNPPLPSPLDEPAPSPLLVVAGRTCVTRREWDAALRVCVAHFGDPLMRADELFAELLCGPLGESMSLAAVA